MTSLLKDTRIRDTGLQAAFVGSILLLFAVFIVTARANLEAQGLTSGFGFLERSTGWRISFSLIEYSTSSTYARAILVGILNSLFLGAIALPLATVIGITVGVMRTSGNGMAELVGTTFVELFRNVPLILQLLFWYTLLLALPSPREVEPIFGSIAFTGRGIYIPGLNVTGGSVFVVSLVVLAGFGLSLWARSKRWPDLQAGQAMRERRILWGLVAIVAVITLWIGRIPDTPLISIPQQKGLNFREGIRISPELTACVIAISIYGAAYIAEIVRAGFNAIPNGQTEAGDALGLSNWQPHTPAIGNSDSHADTDQPICLAFQSHNYWYRHKLYRLLHGDIHFNQPVRSDAGIDCDPDGRIPYHKLHNFLGSEPRQRCDQTQGNAAEDLT